MTTWLELGDLLADEMDRSFALHVPTNLFHPGASFRQYETQLREMNTLTKDAVDIAVVMFSRTDQWPKLPDAAFHMTQLRFACAMDLLNILCLPEPATRFLPDPVGCLKENLLCWLLKTTWEFRSDHWLKLTALHMTEPDSSFY